MIKFYLSYYQRKYFFTKDRYFPGSCAACNLESFFCVLDEEADDGETARVNEDCQQSSRVTK